MVSKFIVISIQGIKLPKKICNPLDFYLSTQYKIYIALYCSRIWVELLKVINFGCFYHMPTSESFRNLVSSLQLKHKFFIALLSLGITNWFVFKPINDAEDIFQLMNDKKSLNARWKCNYSSSNFCMKREGLLQNECFCIILILQFTCYKIDDFYGDQLVIQGLTLKRSDIHILDDE